jgi:SAM-dependent methyltransferase
MKGDELPMEPVALRAYEALAERYAQRIDVKPHNALYERPATLSLLPDVEGKQVMDAGCGPGVYSELLVERGADVIAIDVSPAMVEQARRRLGEKVSVLQANLEEPLTFAESDSFDLIVSPLVLDYIADLPSIFKEFYRVLRSPGHLVFSIGHPFGDFLRHNEGSYFETRLVQETWHGFGGEVNVPFFRRPLEAIVSPLFDAGFFVDRLLEPMPTEEFKRVEPEDYEKIKKQPGFMTIRACKR